MVGQRPLKASEAHRFGGLLPVFMAARAIFLYNLRRVGYNIMAKFDITEEVSEWYASI